MSGEFDAWLETIDSDIGWDISAHPLPDVPNHGRGRGALATDLVATYLCGWNDYSAELKELVDAGDQVVVVVHETAEMRETGVALDRRATFVKIFKTKAEALEAAGRSEQSMSQENVEIVRRALPR